MSSMPTINISYENTMSALRICCDAAQAKEQRVLAESYLVQFRSSPDAWQILVHIFSNSTEAAHTVHVQILALHLLGDAISHIWNKLQADSQEKTRSLVLNVLTENLPIFSNIAFRNKFSAILADLAERQFPQAWPTFISDLVKLWERSHPQIQEIVIKTFEAVLNDCIDADFNSKMLASRKQDIIVGFKEQLEPLLQTSFNFCTVCVQVTSSTAADGNSVSVNSNKAHALSLLSSIYKMVVPLAISAKTASVCTATHDFSYLSTISIGIPELRESAVTLLDALVSQKIPLELLPTFIERISSINIPTDFPDIDASLYFQRSYSKAVYSLVCFNCNELFSDALIANKAYCDVLLKFIGHLINIIKLPAMLGMNDYLKEWLRILNTASFQKLSVSAVIAKEVQLAVLPRSLRMRWNKDADGNYTDAVDEAVEFEFEVFDSYREYYSVVKSQSGKIFSIIAEVYPQVASDSILENLNSLIKTRSSVEGQDYIDKFGQLTKDSSAALEWSAYAFLLTMSMSRLKSHLTDTKVSNICIHVATTILDWSPTDAVYCQAKIECLSGCAPLMASSIEFLNKSMSCLFGYLNFIDSESRSIGKLSDMAQAVIISSAEAVVHICKVNKSMLLNPAFPLQQVVSEIAKTLKLESISNIAIVHMRETLVILSELFEDRTTKMSFFELALSDLLSQFNGNAKYGKSLLEVFASPTTLLDACIRHQPLLQEGSFTIRSFYNSLKQTQAALLPDECWTSGIAISMDNLTALTPITSVWAQVIPLVTPICSTIHQFLSPQARKQIHDSYPNLEYIYVPTIFEAKRHAGIEVLGSKKASIDPIAYFARNTFESMKMNIYMLLGQASLHRVVYTNDAFGSAVKQLIVSLSSSTIFMEHTDMISFLRSFAEKYVMNAIPGDFSTVAHVMNIIITNCNQRLNAAWNPQVLASKENGAYFKTLFYECNLPAGYAELSTEERELAQTSFIGDFTSQYSDFLATCACLKGILCPKPDAKSAVGTGGTPRAGDGDGDGAKDVADAPTADGNGYMVDDDMGTCGTGMGPVVSEGILSVRRLSLRRLIFTFEPLMLSFINSATSLLCVPHAGACRRGMDLAYFLLENAGLSPRIQQTMGQDIFGACLQILFKDDSWSSGLEWDVIDLINSIYCILVLGLPFSAVTTSRSAAVASNPAPATICDFPRQIILQIPHIDPRKVQELETYLAENQVASRTQTKKMRRQYWKDFIGGLISAQNQRDPSNTASHRSGGSVFDTKVPQILDIRAKLMDTTFIKHSNANEPILDVDLSRLFDK